jgi:hypothetical protein
MRLLPERVTIPTKKLVALIELASWGCRSEAERMLVDGLNRDLDEMSAQAARKIATRQSSGVEALKSGGRDAPNQ